LSSPNSCRFFATSSMWVTCVNSVRMVSKNVFVYLVMILGRYLYITSGSLNVLSLSNFRGKSIIISVTYLTSLPTRTKTEQRYHHHHQLINVSTAGALHYGLHIRRTSHNLPRGPSAGWRVLTTANAAETNGLTCLPKHGGT
jgi:hypothetical protein